jgi:hypothetical protein
MGMVGLPGSPKNLSHVHLVLATRPLPGPGGLEFTEDPLAITLGCFDPTKVYPDDPLVLTYPVHCND